MSWWFHKNKPVEKSFEFLDCVVNQIETGIVCLTHDYKVLYMNKKMREQLKIEKDNNTEIDFFDFIPEEEKKQFEYIFKNIRFSKTATFTLKLKINNIVELYECLGKYEKNESKDFYTFSLISPAKYQQNARQLANAQKFEILGRLTSGFAHDFNNLLAAAIGYITLLKQPDKKSEKLDLYLDKLDTVLSDGANSLRKILLFSRSEIEELKPINLKTFITELLDFIDKLIRSNIKIDVKIPAESVYVNSSPTKLEQVIINLLINARDAIEGPGKISIKTSHDDFKQDERSFYPSVKPGKYVLISIKDTGKGIPEEILGKIFEPFFSTKKESGGSGLGMFIVYETLQSLNGGIKINSKVDQGTECIIALPLAKTKLQKKDQEKEIHKFPVNVSLLIIEDDVEVSEILIEMLKTLEYKPYIRRTAKSGLKFLETKKQPDLILMDFGLPDMEGKELYKELTKKYTAPVLITTGYTKKELIEVIPYLKTQMILSKPFHLSKLQNSIKWALENKDET